MNQPKYIPIEFTKNTFRYFGISVNISGQITDNSVIKVTFWRYVDFKVDPLTLNLVFSQDIIVV